MATTGQGTGHLAYLTQRRAQLQKVRSNLSASAGPQSNVRPAAPTPKAPASEPPPAPTTAQTQGAAVGGTSEARQRDPEMLAQAQEFLATAQNQGKPQADAPPTITGAPPAFPQPLTEQIQRVGGEGLSAQAQFMRINGRAPSGRELYVYGQKANLEMELGRPPTRMELMLRVTRSDSQNRGPEPVAM